MSIARTILSLNLRSLQNYFAGNKTKNQIHKTRDEEDHLSPILTIDKQKFIFRHGESIERQLNAFKELQNNDKWDGRIAFLGFKGLFKFEYWAQIENAMRSISSSELKKITFIDTKIENEHLDLLLSIIQWIQPQDLQLKFKQNELDDGEMEKFVREGILKSFSDIIKSLEVISNPGVYKGHMLKRLKEMIKEINSRNKQFELQFLQNKGSKSFAYIKIPLNQNHDEIKIIKEKIQEKLKETFYYKLNLKNCFTQDNNEGLFHLIDESYNNQKLEQIEVLDISGSFVNQVAKFQKICQKISTSKGLLELGIANMPIFEDNQVMQSLMGDRYDKLRLNHLDFSDNQSFLELSLKTLAQNLFSNSLKTVNFKNSLTQHLPVLVKILYISDIMKAQNEKLYKESIKEGYIKKQKFTKLDLSSLDNYNRHDLIQFFVLQLVFNEHSSIKQLVCQNFDIGRIKSWLKAIQIFENHISQQKIFFPVIYKEFKPKLFSIEIPKQTFRMEQEPLHDFFKFCFTNDNSLFNITELTLNNCFRQTGREEGLVEFCKSLKPLYESNPQVKFTLNKLTFEDSVFTSELGWELIFEDIVFNSHFQMESLTIIKEELSNEILQSSIQNFLDKINTDKICCLKHLKLIDIEIELKIFEFFDLIIFKKYIQLESLVMINIPVIDNEEQRKSLIILSDEPQFQTSLKKISLGPFINTTNEIDSAIIEILILNDQSQLVDIEIHSLLLKQNINFLKDKMLVKIQNGFKPLDCLNKLKIQMIVELTQEEWEYFSDVFIFSKYINLKTLEINEMLVNDQFIQGFSASKAKRMQQMGQEEQSQNTFHLNSLIINKCSFEVEFLSIFFTSIMCQLERLHIIESTNFDIVLQKLKNIYNEESNFLEYLTVSLTEFVMDGTEINDISLFEWFIQDIVFNKKRQRVQKLSFQNCGIKSEEMDIISKSIMGLQKFQSDHKIKKYFSLREINLSQNNQISSKDWKDLFNILFTVYDQSINDNINSDLQQDLVQHNLYLKQQQTLDKIELKEILTDETKKIIFEKKLNLENKILDVRNPIKIQVPSQLKEIDINLQFQLEKSIKGELYQRIMRGIVFFPQSNIEKVKFNNLDLELFMIASVKAIQYLKNYHKIWINNNSNQKMIMKLKYLNIQNLTNASQQNVSKLADLYLDNEIFNLEGLTIESLSSGDIYNDILRNLKQKLNQGQELTLKQLELKSVKSILNIEETLSFFRTIILNIAVPLEILHLGLSIEFNSEENFKEQILNHLNAQNQIISLKNLEIKINNNQSFKTFQSFIPFIFTSKYIQIQKFDYHNDEKEDLKTYIGIGNKLEAQIYCNLLKEITFFQEICFTLEEFKIFYYLRPQLKKLNLYNINTKFWIKKDIENFMIAQQNKIQNLSIQQKCKLIIKIVKDDDNETDILNKFVFGKFFEWTNIQLNSFKTFEKLQNVNLFDTFSLEKPFLKILCINFDILYNSSLQLSEQSLKLIGDSFIYNENSILEELIIKQCHLKPPGIKSLTSSAENFRATIQKNNQVKTMKLKLKRFSIYYSLYLLEAQDIISQDIVFFEYITIERYENNVTNFNDRDAINLCKAANKWLQFQLENKRQIQEQFFIKYLDIGRNEFVQSKEAWDLLCDIFIFTDRAPFLEELNIHFMSLQDFHVDWICEKANDFLMWKPYNYVHPIKFINFQLNTALSSKGWQKICENFFFNKHFKLEQLNLISTMLDTEEKVDAVKNAMISRALSEKTQKLRMHTFLCYNCQIKLPLMQYMSPKPLNYIPNQDVMVDIFDCSSFGMIDGVPLSFGNRVSLITKAIYQSQNFFIANFWKDDNDLRFSQYHLDIVEGFLKPLNQLFDEQIQLENSLPISYKSIDQLCTFFKYRINNGDPYPISIFFSTSAIQYYHSFDCKIRSIDFIGTTLKKQELVQQIHVFKLWEAMKSEKSSFDIIFMEYTIDDDLIDIMFEKGYNEIDLINLVRLIPPSQMKFQNSLSLQAIKGIYSIMWDNYKFSYSNISIDKHIFLNVGIGYSLREYVYNSNPQNLITKGMKRFCYYFFSIFVSSVPKYNFSEQIKDLNKYLSNQSIMFWMLIFITLIYYAVCVYASFYFTMNYGKKLKDSSELDKDQICLQGPHIYGLYSYVLIAFISFLFEGFLYKNVTLIIPQHIIGIFEIEDQNQTRKNLNNNVDELIINGKKLNNTPNEEESNLVIKQSLQIKNQLNTFSKSKTFIYIGYLKQILLGQLAKFDLFNDISFILSCYFCQFEQLFIIALVVTIFNLAVNAMNLLRFIYQRIMEDKSNKKKLSTKYINDFYSISIIGRNQALSNVLDTVAPFNVSSIPNNFFMKFFFPQIAGKCISNSVKIYLMKFSFEDLPQILLQIIFLFHVSLKLNQPINISTWITITISSFSLGLSFFKYFKSYFNTISFMSIRPSSLNQYDFDDLSKKKSDQSQDFEIEELRKEQEIIKALTGQETNIIQNDYQDDIEVIVDQND